MDSDVFTNPDSDEELLEEAVEEETGVDGASGSGAESHAEEGTGAESHAREETAADLAGGEWVDVRMTNPEAGEWDVDVVVVDGRVEYVDLRIRAELLASFVDCLVEDATDRRARAVLERVAENHGLNLEDLSE